MRNLKVLGLALVAALAMSAVVASAASAQFESEAASTTLKESSSETQVFSYTGSTKLTCETVTLDNSVQTKAATETVTVTPTYSGDCTGPLGIGTTIDMNDCTYTFTLKDNETSGPAPDINCPDGKEITITVGELCTFHIKGQAGEEAPGGTITYSNVGTGKTREVKLTPNVTGIDGTRTGSALCGAATSSTGTYSGAVTITGEAEGAHVGVFVD